MSTSKSHVVNYQDDDYIVVVDGMRCEIAYCASSQDVCVALRGKVERVGGC